MESTKKQQIANEFLTRVYTKAWEDEDFKRDLVNNPNVALSKFTGKAANFAEEKKVIVMDQTNPDHIYINIPAKPNMDDVELSEDQLEMVAGGADRPWYDIHGHAADLAASAAVAILDAAGYFD
ncbi:NHLP leader peptide family RiPP precursor [Kordia sp.]|uniref:NHLP leader peptide family RiPP precursor n=1 Tax=Kordia sp. TaxID=1965332 RepID=UPI003D6BEB09